MGRNAVTVLRKHPINEMQAFMKEGVVAFENGDAGVCIGGMLLVTTAVAYMMFRPRGVENEGGVAMGKLLRAELYQLVRKKIFI